MSKSATGKQSAVKKRVTAKSRGRRLATTSVKCLVTGFDEFGGLKSNPSQKITERMPEEIGTAKGDSNISIDRLVLPTAGKSAWRLLRAKFDSEGVPEILILVGVAAVRHNISLERFAMNIRDYRIADNEKYQPLDEPIDTKARDLLRTSVVLSELQKHLINEGFLCEISNHAGSFVCNDIYFQALQMQEKERALQAVLFIHVPLPKTYHRAMSKNGKKSRKLSSSSKLRGLDKAVVEIIKFCAAKKSLNKKSGSKKILKRSSH